MPANIIIDQAAKPPGVAGKAREDLALGTDISLAAAGGPFASHLWSIIDKPVDIITPALSASLLATPTASTTLVSPVDVEGTYLVELLVDSGSGIGATADDIARITFYAGAALAANPLLLPRREPAFRETIEHNVNDGVFPAGNPRGWGQEWLRWFAIIRNLAGSAATEFASGRVSLPGGGPAAVVGTASNITTVTRTGVGVVDVVFTLAAPDANYSVIATARGTPGGSCTVTAEAAGQFTITRADGAGAVVDADFNLQVKLN